MLNIQNSENPSRSIGTADENGNRVEILRVSCNLRPASGLHLNIDVIDANRVAASLEAVEREMTCFVTDAFARAAAMGLPVPAVGGSDSA